MRSQSLPPFPVQDYVEFRHIPHAFGYCVSSDGHYYRCVHNRRKDGSYTTYDTWREIKGKQHPKGYINTSILKRNIGLHVLILETFVGPCPPGLECCHADGNPANNAITNLRWDTHQANMQDLKAHGHSPDGEKSHFAKLTAQDVIDIRTLYTQGVTQTALATRYGVNQTCISLITRGENWKHLPLNTQPSTKKTHKLTLSQRQEIQTLQQNGASNRFIAETFHIDITYAWLLRKKSSQVHDR